MPSPAMYLGIGCNHKGQKQYYNERDEIMAKMQPLISL